jgi:hypothetical protein
MRTFFAATAIVFCATALSLAADSTTETKSADTAKAIAADKPTVEFDNQTLTLAFEGNDPGESIKEYIPTGETLDKWTKLAATREYENLNNPLAMAAELQKQLKEKYPDSTCTVTENKEDNSAVVDFVLWAPDKSFAEFNIFKYVKTDEGGIYCEQYALRDYTDPKKFVDGLKETRDRTVKEMTEDGLTVEE